MSLSVYAVYLTLILLGLVSGALANTEIRNVKVESLPYIDVARSLKSWSVLDSHVTEIPLALRVCPPSIEGRSMECELAEYTWVVLDFDDPAWSGYNGFTVKISNSASVPVDIEMELFTPPALVAHIADANASFIDLTSLPSTHKQYVHINSKLSSVPSPLHAGKAITARFNLSVEPLFLGIVPLSVLPLIASIPALLLLAHLATTYFVMPMLDTVVADVRTHMDDLSKKQ